MRSLTYISTAVRGFSDAELMDLSAHALKRNAELGVTGILVFNGLNFLQTLEGSSSAVETVLASIERDRRHAGLHVVNDRRLASREIPEWGMAYHRVTDSEIANVLFTKVGGAVGAIQIPIALQQIYNSFRGIKGVPRR